MQTMNHPYTNGMCYGFVSSCRGNKFGLLQEISVEISLFLQVLVSILLVLKLLILVAGGALMGEMEQAHSVCLTCSSRVFAHACSHARMS